MLSLLVSGLFGACNCGTKFHPIAVPDCKQNDDCKTDQDCQDLKSKTGKDGKPADADPTNWTCRTDIHLCVEKQRACNDDTDCGPGQGCNTSISICTDKSVSCTTDDPSACTAKGQYCNPNLGVFPMAPGCSFHTCDDDSGCPDGLSCFNGYCVGEPPCNGGCGPQQVCTPVNNFCHKLKVDDSGNLDPSVDPSCGQTCNPGTILVYTDGHNVFNSFNPGLVNSCDSKSGSAMTCQCAPLPPVQTYDSARFSSSVVAGDKILVSAYDGDHGDLVMHTYSKGDANSAIQKIGTEWIDGVPSTGTVVGRTDGPRGGRADPGPDVGQYTSIAYEPNAGVTHISYYAVKDGNTPLGDLRYAMRVGAGPGGWVTYTVDGSDSAGNDTGDVGMYSNITLAPDGSPVIAYFQKAGAGSTTLQTALKVARAKKAQPMNASDWTITVVDTGSRTPPPCNGMCSSNQACANDGTPTGTCYAKASASACTAGCKSTEFCGLDSSMTPTCFATLTTSGLASLPDGNGLWPAISYLDDKPVVVWYDHANGELKGAVATADSADQGAAFNPNNIQVLDDGKVANSSLIHDVGRFTSLAIGGSDAPARIAVTYFDSTGKQLRLLTAQPDWSGITAPDQRVLDDGTMDGNGDPVLFVGSDSSVKFFGGNISVIYQDATGGNLRLADQTSPTDKVAYRQTVASQGACGFYAKQLVDGSSRYATHAIIKAASASQSANQLDVLRLP